MALTQARVDQMERRIRRALDERAHLFARAGLGESAIPPHTREVSCQEALELIDTWRRVHPPNELCAVCNEPLPIDDDPNLIHTPGLERVHAETCCFECGGSK